MNHEIIGRCMGGAMKTFRQAAAAAGKASNDRWHCEAQPAARAEHPVALHKGMYRVCYML